MKSLARRGFTIVELSVVVAIIGLMAYTVTVGLDTILPGERLNTSVRRLAAELHSTRSDAIARNSEFRVEYDLDENRYRVQTPFRLGGGATIRRTEDDYDFDEEEQRFVLPWDLLDEGVEIATVQLAGEQYVEGRVLVAFDPLGAASDHTVVLTQPAFETFFSIEVLALTGLIRFHDGFFLREPPEEGDFD